MEKKRLLQILIYVMLVTFILSGCQPLTQTGKKDTEQDQETQTQLLLCNPLFQPFLADILAKE